jgi:plastocyanin
MTATQTAMLGQHADITIVVEGHSGGSLGPDGKTHDTMMPSNFTVYVGQTVGLTFINYDEGPHSFTSTDLGVNFIIPGRTATSVPSVSHFQFTPTKAGVFRWWCLIACDTGQGGWAMTTGTDGGIGQLGFMAGYVTVMG